MEITQEARVNLTNRILNTSDRMDTRKCNGAKVLRRAISLGKIKVKEGSTVNWGATYGHLNEATDDEIKVGAFDLEGNAVNMMNATQPQPIILRVYAQDE